MKRLDSPNLDNSSLQGVKDALGLVLEQFEHFGSVHPTNRWGCAESYIKGQTALEMGLRFAKWPGEKFKVIIHRVPSRTDPKSVRNCTSERGFEALSGCTYGQPDGVLAVRDFCCLPDHIVTAGIGFSSWIWLLKSDDIPHLQRDFRLGGFRTFEFPVEVRNRVVCPRKVSIPNRATNGLAGSKKGLVETVPQVVQGLGQLSSDEVWDWIYLPDDCGRNPSFRIVFNQYNYVLIIDEILRGEISFDNCLMRPINELLGVLE